MKKIMSVMFAIMLLFCMTACKDTDSVKSFDKQQEEYAKLLIDTGINLEKGEKLMILAQSECYEFVRLCVEAAYETGAADVIVNYIDDENTHQRNNNADKEALGDYSEYTDELYRQCYEEKIPLLKLRSTHPGIMADVDSERLAIADAAVGEYQIKYENARTNNEVRWTVAGVPNKYWAKVVFPDLSEEEAMEKLWDSVLKTVYVSGDGNAEEIWKEHISNLDDNARMLNRLNIKSLHYTNSIGTDFTVDIPEDAIWVSSASTSQDGIDFTKNIPTEEIYTAPVADSANGVIVASLPLELNGTMVNDIEFTVKNGEIVKSSASEGIEVLNETLDYDEGSRFFGEIALVPYDSPISQQGILFHDTLFDENSSCHIAFGDAYPECIKGGMEMTADELIEAGLNKSDKHVDFMLGTSDLKIVGTTYDGEDIVIFEDGSFSDQFLILQEN